MTSTKQNTAKAIKAEIQNRISARDWKPGEFIPNEVDLAQEFGCSRATINKVLQDLANNGLLDRRRKAGTRVVINPVRKATLKIPIVREEIEQRGHQYGYRLLKQDMAPPPPHIAAQFKHQDSNPLLHVQALYFADERPYLYEDRWINHILVSEALTIDFATISSNEWLVQNSPYTHGEIMLCALNATPKQAELLEVDTGAALFIIDRITWQDAQAITQVRLAYAPGYHLHTLL